MRRCADGACAKDHLIPKTNRLNPDLTSADFLHSEPSDRTVVPHIDLRLQRTSSHTRRQRNVEASKAGSSP